MTEEEFNLSEEENYCKECGINYPALKVKEFIKLLKEASENNDWEVAINGVEEDDSFKIITGVEFIDKLAGKSFIGEKMVK